MNRGAVFAKPSRQILRNILWLVFLNAFCNETFILCFFPMFPYRIKNLIHASIVLMNWEPTKVEPVSNTNQPASWFETDGFLLSDCMLKAGTME